VTGGSTQYKGVEPDIVLPSLFKHIESGERYLEYSLPWDSIAAVEYTPYPKQLDIEKLKERNAKRVKKDSEFQTIALESSKAVDRSKNTVVSLDIDDIRARLEEARKARDTIGAFYKQYQEEEGEEEDFEADNATPEEKKREWAEEINEDPYVREAARIIGDILNP
jgi:carboxyl-terminal processing protease